MTRWLVGAVIVGGVAWLLLSESAPGARRERRKAAPERQASPARWPAGLDDPDPDRRRAAAVALRNRGDAAVPIFVDLLRNGTPEQRILAARSLGRMERGVDELIAALDPGDVELCIEVLRALDRIEFERSGRWVLPLLAEPRLQLAALRNLRARSPDVVAAVANLIDPVRAGEVDKAALDALGFAPGGLPQILAAIEQPRLLLEAVSALERLGPAAHSAVTVLVRIIREEERREQKALEEMSDDSLEFMHGWHPEYWAANALVAIGESSIPEALAMLDDDLAGVRSLAGDILGRIGDAVRPALVRAAADPSARIRAAAAAALERHASKDPALLPVLVSLSEDRDKNVRLAAVATLGAFGRAATPGLRARLRETDKEVLDATLDSLRAVEPTDPGLVPDLARLLRHEHYEIQWGAASVLGAMGDHAGDGVVALVSALDSADRFLRTSISEALVAIGSPAIPALLARVHRAPAAAQAVALQVFVELDANGTEVRAACDRLLRSPSASTRIRSASLLGGFDDPPDAVLPTLRAGLEHRSGFVRQVAVDGLQRLGPAALPAVPDLLRFARAEDERDDPPQVHVYDALAAAGDAAIPQLVAALGSDSWNVRYDAAEALEQLGRAAVPQLARCPPSVREYAIAVLQTQARAVPEARAALVEWAKDPRVEVRLLALDALWRGTWDAKAVVPGLLKLAPTNETARYQLSRIGAHAVFALDEIRAIHAKTRDEYLATAIRRIENR